METIRCRYMQRADLQSIQDLLRHNGLPIEGIERNMATFLVLEKEGRVVGCGGVELLGRSGLLRSLAVVEQERSRGYGRLLVDQLFAVASLHAVDDLFLLTVDKMGFFEKIGFSPIPRAEAPQRVRATELCTVHCCGTATCMTKSLRGQPLHYGKETLQLKKDLPGVEMWAVALEKTMLTYFTVEANASFPEHRHESEQITMVLSGSLYFSMAGKISRVGEGEVIAIPANLPHAVHTREEPARAVDAWSPVMEKYRQGHRGEGKKNE